MAHKKINCIDGIITLMKEYEMDSVKIFPNRSLSIKTLGASFALNDFLNSINIPSQVIICNSSRVKEEFPVHYKKIDSPNFVAIAIDCRRDGDIENSLYTESHILMDIFGPSVTKGFGVLNCIQKNICGASEILYEHILEYCNKHNKPFPLSTAQLLYVSIIGGTKRFGNNIRGNTLNVTQELLKMGVNYQLANELSEYKNEKSLICQELILKHVRNHGSIMTIVLSIEDIPDSITIEDFKDSLDSFRCVKNSLVWLLLIENENGYYNVIIQGKETNPFSVNRIAIKNNGEGDQTDAQCIIPIEDFNKLFHETSLLVEIAKHTPLSLENIKPNSIFDLVSQQSEEDVCDLDNILDELIDDEDSDDEAEEDLDSEDNE